MENSDLYFKMVFELQANDPEVTKVTVRDGGEDTKQRREPRIIEEHYAYVNKASEINSMMFLQLIQYFREEK